VPQKQFGETSTGDILSRITNDVSVLQQGMTNSLPTMISAATQFIGCLIMMFVTEWHLALTAVLITMVGMVLLMLIMGRSQKYFKQRQVSLGALNGYVEEMYSGHDVVRISRAEKKVLNRFGKLNRDVYDANWKSQFLSGMMQPLMNVIGNLSYVAVCVIGAALAISGTIKFGVIISFILYVRLFTAPLTQIAQGMTNLQTATAGAGRIFEFMEAEELEDEGGKPRHETDDTKGAVVKLRLNVPTDSTQPSGNLTVKNIFSLKEGGFLDPAATAYIDTSVVGKWQYVYFDYSSISGKNGSMRRFDVFGLKDGWSIDVDYIHFILDDDVVYSVLTPQITVETKGENGYVKYTFDGECALSSTEFDAIAGGHGFGTSTKTADENGNSVYTYTTTLNNVSGTALPSVVKGVSVEAGKLSGIYLPYVRFNKIQPTTIQLASMRIDPNGTYQGVRYMGYTTSDMKADAKEIGFIIAIADNVSDINDLRFGENPVEGQGNVNEAGIKYVYGSAYLKDSHDKIYANTSAEAGIDGDSRYTDMSGYFFTAVLVGITEDKYETKFVGRPYVKIGTEYFYGEPVTRNIKEVAKAVADGGYKGLDDAQKAYINNILGIN